mmetsp:Transcript_16252/g.21815  ORF Transcript_16252/g.21815 Transcript_16252/m.21815 type:complete len:86 (-) Transcript_16252:1008-1265(-)
MTFSTRVGISRDKVSVRCVCNTSLALEMTADVFQSVLSKSNVMTLICEVVAVSIVLVAVVESSELLNLFLLVYVCMYVYAYIYLN